MSQTHAAKPTKFPALVNQEGNNRVLDAVINKLQLKNDAALSRALEVAPPVISKIRHARLPVGATLLIRMHEITDMPIRQLKGIALGFA